MENEIKPYSNLRGADLRGANLQEADLRGSNLQEADLQGANLQGADLRRANLHRADLWEANLQGANLQEANLLRANLMKANLQGANLDFSCWPLWCGSQGVKIDEKQAKQLLAHAFNVAIEFWPGELTQEQLRWINSFHTIQTKEFKEVKNYEPTSRS